MNKLKKNSILVAMVETPWTDYPVDLRTINGVTTNATFKLSSLI